MFDVVIVGGGPVGATLAVALGSRGFAVALIEARANTDAGDFAPAVYEARVSSLTRASERILRSLGVWDLLPSERLGVIRDMHVWDRQGVGEIHFDSAEIAEPCLGFIVENRVLEWAAGRRLTELGFVTQYRGQQLIDVQVCASSVTVTTNEASLEAQLVVGADGTDSRVRECVGIKAESAEYGQRAVVSVVRTGQSHRDTAWQRFLPGGPIALLPLPDNQCCVVWSMKPPDAERLLALPETTFALELEGATQLRLGSFLPVGPRAAFGLRSLKANAYAQERVALVGDAAHTIHPLAGQGVNLGLYDAAALAETLVNAREAGRPISAYSTLRRYERWRRGHNAAMQTTMDLLFRLFGSTFPVVGQLRNLGLNATDRVMPLKRLIMRQASGLEGDLPACARKNL
jgi:2-octaprenylphenol hydroxylase